MKGKYMERLVGKYCKIVTKEPGDDRAGVVTGVLEDVDYKDGFILVNSSQGLGCLRIDTIIAIKPSSKRQDNQPKHVKKILKDDDEAMVGIGTLIVFIALVLIAAVASSVIIQTSESLQQRAYAVGKQTIRQVSSGMEIIGLTGYTNAAKTKIVTLAVSIKPRAGSYDIDMNETLMYIEYDNLTVLSLDWSGVDVITGTISANGVFQTLNHSNLSSTEFGMIAIRDIDNSITNSYGMSTVDMVLIMVNLTAVFPTTGGLATGEEFIGRLVPEVGSSGIFLCSAPSAFDYRVVEL